MKSKIKIRCYECKKCDKRVYYRSNEEYSTICKTCKSEMQFVCEHDYRPENGLVAIKDSNKKRNAGIKSSISKTIIGCPYCHSTNTAKIGFFSRLASAELWGLGSDKIGKQFHCNNCGANF